MKDVMNEDDKYAAHSNEMTPICKERGKSHGISHSQGYKAIFTLGASVALRYCLKMMFDNSRVRTSPFSLPY